VETIIDLLDTIFDGNTGHTEPQNVKCPLGLPNIGRPSGGDKKVIEPVQIARVGSKDKALLLEKHFQHLHKLNLPHSEDCSLTTIIQ
ncbi:MAG: hypothetical protein WBQ60_12675, partial [Asticcacaulis sp.]